MDMRNAAIEYTMGQYFSSSIDEIGRLKAFELLLASVASRDDDPSLQACEPFVNWTHAELLEHISTDIFILTALLHEAHDSAGVPR